MVQPPKILALGYRERLLEFIRRRLREEWNHKIGQLSPLSFNQEVLKEAS